MEHSVNQYQVIEAMTAENIEAKNFNIVLVNELIRDHCDFSLHTVDDIKQFLSSNVHKIKEYLLVTPNIICESCSETLTLNNSWANQCQCGTEYNGFGQMLAPRYQWGEETGERF